MYEYSYGIVLISISLNHIYTFLRNTVRENDIIFKIRTARNYSYASSLQ